MESHEQVPFSSIPSLLVKWEKESSENHRLVKRIFDISVDSGLMSLSQEVERNLMTAFQTDDKAIMESVVQQEIVYVHNLWTNEAAVFNQVRKYRPGISADSKQERKLVEDISFETEQNCVFCKYEDNTASDVFGRLESQHSVTVANLFKYDSWHSMVLLRTHHPLAWGAEHLLDMMTLAYSWFEKMKSVAPENIYPMILWDTLPRSGGSQVHQHIHMSLSKKRYLGQLENWRQASLRYQDKFPGRCYFADYIECHRVLGLTFQHGEAIAIAHMTPKKDCEFIVLSAQPNSDFYHLLFFVSKVYTEEICQSSFSVAMAYPPLNRKCPEMYAFARMAPRGSLTSTRSDISSMELFAGCSCTVEPSKLISMLRKVVEKHSIIINSPS